MKTINLFIILLLVLISGSVNAQLGIGTTNPDDSSVVDMVSTDKGLLSPRMTKTERNAIQNPATGLLIYNTTNSRFNYYNAGWKDFSTDYKTVSQSDTIVTNSKNKFLVPGMTLTPKAGKYLVNFSCQYINNTSLAPVTYVVDTEVCLANLFSVYNVLHLFPATSNHGNNSNFGGTLAVPEVITPGKYYINGAIAAGGFLTLDAGGDADAVFIFEANGAINFAAGTEIKLAGDAQSCNVFWVGEGAIGVGANSKMVGTLLSHGYPVSAGDGTVLDGRMFSTSGAIAFGPGTATKPSALSTTINLASLSTFVAFTGLGAINNTGTQYTSFYNGDIASFNGATTSLLVPPGGASGATVNGTIFPSGSTTTTNPFVLSTASFSIYQNGVLLPESVRTINSKISSSNISLQAIATVAEGEAIEIKWKTDSGTLTVGKRNLTLTKVIGL
jgi:hypothetical protein